MRLRFFHFLGQRGKDLEKIADDTEVGDAEDGRFRIFVDRDDVLRRRHPRQMLDRTRDATGDVEIRADDATRLSDLMLMIDPARVDGRARSANGTADRMSEI